MLLDDLPFIMNEINHSGRIVIAGGSGFLGKHLSQHLTNLGYEVVVLSRYEAKEPKPWKTVTWDARSLENWAEQLDGAVGLVNLVGRTVDCIKTPDHCDEILRSRVEATLVLGQAVRSIETPPPVWVQMSTAHIYGDPPEMWCDEDSALGYGLAPEVGKAWEKACDEAVLPSMRVVKLRTGFVIGQGGGALQRLGFLAKLGLGGKVGHGRQGMSWIHIEDMNRIFERALANDQMQGIHIATAPNPVSQAEFMKELRKAIGMPIGLPAFSWMVRIGAPVFLRTDPELALYGRYCVSNRLEEEGFGFKFPNLDEAMADLMRHQNNKPA